MPSVQSGATIAVTGATGFIGSHIVAQLLAAGFHVRAVVRNPNDAEKIAHLTTLPGAAERLTAWSGELNVEGSYDAAFNGADAVVHTAAVVEINSVKDPKTQIVDPSVQGVKNVLGSAERSSTVKRFVHTSSEIAAMKWDEPLDSVFDEGSWNTASTVENGDPYGYAKALAEKIVLDHKSDHFDSVAILPGVNLGPCMTKSHTKSSAVVIRQFLYGNSQPEYHAQFVDVRDTASAHVLALSASIESGDSRRFIVCLEDAGMVSGLEAPLQRLFPDYELAANPHPGFALKVVMRIPLLGRMFASDFQRTFIEQHFRMDSGKSRSKLGVTYRPLDETLLDTVKSMVDSGFVKPRTKSKAGGQRSESSVC